MENTTHNLFEESLSAKINRLEQTIRELKNIIEVSTWQTQLAYKINRRQEEELKLIKELNPDLRTDY